MGRALSSFDRFIIGVIVGATAVTHYTIPYNLASRTNVLVVSLSGALFPRFSAVDKEEQARLADQAVKVLLVVLTPVIISGVLLMEPFLHWWISAEFAKQSATVGEVIALGLWANGLANIPFAQLQAQGKPDVVAKCHLAELLPYLFFLVIALKHWGVVGAACVWSLRVSADAVLLFYFSDYKFLTSVHVWPVAMLSITAFSVFMFPVQAPERWFAGFAVLVVCVFWSWRNAPQSLKRMIRLPAFTIQP